MPFFFLTRDGCWWKRYNGKAWLIIKLTNRRKMTAKESRDFIWLFWQKRIILSKGANLFRSPFLYGQNKWFFWITTDPRSPDRMFWGLIALYQKLPLQSRKDCYFKWRASCTFRWRWLEHDARRLSAGYWYTAQSFNGYAEFLKESQRFSRLKWPTLRKGFRWFWSGGRKVLF